MTDHNRTECVKAVEDLLIAMNQVSDTGVDLTLDAVKSMFTEDCEMVLNNQFICKGHDGLLEHSKDIRKKLRSWRFNLPFERTVVENGEVFVYYTCDTVSHDGTQGRVYDMCIYSTRNGKISGVCEVVHFEGHQVDLDTLS